MISPNKICNSNIPSISEISCISKDRTKKNREKLQDMYKKRQELNKKPKRSI